MRVTSAQVVGGAMVLMLALVSSARAQITPGAIVTLNAADNPGNPNTWDNVANNGSPTLPGSYEFGTCVGGGGCDLGGTQPQLMSENVPGQGTLDFYRGGPNRGGMAENGSQPDIMDEVINGLSIELWIRQNGDSSDQNEAAVLFFGDDDGQNGAMAFFLHGDHKGKLDLSTGCGNCRDDGLGSMGENVNDFATLSTTTFDHVVGTFEETGNILTTYLNGVDVTAGKILYPEAEPWSWKSAIHDDLRFGGQRPGELGGATAAPVDYNLVRIYPFALTSTEVTNNFNAGPGSILESAGPCAFDGDSICSTDDLDALYAVFGTDVPPTDSLFDLNSDNVVNVDDLNQWLTLAASEHGYGSAYLPGDTDLDRDIDLTDFTGLAANFDPGGTYGPYLWGQGNFDGDGNIDLSDYNSLASNFSAVGYGTEAVPEPTTLCLLVAGILLLATSRVGS